MVLATIFASLGSWQVKRKAEKQTLFDRFENAPLLNIGDALEQGERFALVSANGQFDTERHVLLDNRILDGRAGVHVLTPFTLEDGRSLLVNRGWLPLPADRRSLPEVPTDDAPRVITGRLNRLPSDGPRVGDADVLTTNNWPQLVTYLDLTTVEDALGLTLLPWLVQLDADQDEGFDGRQWRAAVMPPEVHGAYALQWFGLMAAAIIIWITLGLRQGAASSRLNNEKES